MARRPSGAPKGRLRGVASLDGLLRVLAMAAEPIKTLFIL